MMEFLRALAPSHTAAKTRAVPVVRSRFEDSRPLTQVPAVHAETPSQSSIVEQREMGRRPRAVTRSTDPARDDDSVRATPADRHVVTPSESHVTIVPVPERLSVRSTPQPLQVRAVPATLETAARAERARVVPRAAGTPVFRRAIQPVSAPLQASALPVGVTMPEAAGSLSARGPLSSNAVAARTESRSDTRPIIHVTIDRIDVRAPSPPERTSSRPRARSNASASLSDYLRSRPASRSGGTS